MEKLFHLPDSFSTAYDEILVVPEKVVAVMIKDAEVEVWLEGGHKITGKLTYDRYESFIMNLDEELAKTTDPTNNHQT